MWECSGEMGCKYQLEKVEWNWEFRYGYWIEVCTLHRWLVLHYLWTSTAVWRAVLPKHIKNRSFHHLGESSNCLGYALCSILFWFYSSIVVVCARCLNHWSCPESLLYLEDSLQLSNGFDWQNRNIQISTSNIKQNIGIDLLKLMENPTQSAFDKDL